MGVLIDSSVLIAAERGQVDLEAALAAHGGEPAAMAAITASELLHGVHRLSGIRRARAELLVNRLLASLPVIPFDLEVARVHAALGAELLDRGAPVGAHDLMIAATAAAMDYAVATRDMRSFGRIQGLQVLRW